MTAQHNKTDPKRLKGFLPKKSFGQNFLVNKNVVAKIISACAIKPEDTVLEIGPGKGALTREILKRAQFAVIVEKDRKLAEYLQSILEGEDFRIESRDFLKFDLSTIPPGTKVIGNLPYNAATPIIKHLIEHKKRVCEMFFTVQREYANRLCAGPGSKDYGSLSLYVQYHCEAKKLFVIKPASFSPKPKVQSCFICLTPRGKPPVDCRNEEFLFHVIRQSFRHRRKTLVNSLDGEFSKQRVEKILGRLKLKPDIRAENLTLKDFFRLSESLKEKK